MTKRQIILAFSLALLIAVVASAHEEPAADPATPLNKERPITALESVFIEALTWMEVRDAIAQGKTRVIIATGGVEQNGPYVATGKHNYILQVVTERLAHKLGDTLVAPIVGFVPEGDFKPKTGHLRYPGTIGVQESTFKALLLDIAASLRAHGFREIVLLGDSGGNQQPMQEVANELTVKWAGSPKVRYIPEFYDYQAVRDWLRARGYNETPEGIHDELAFTLQLLAIDKTLIRAEQRKAAGLLSLNGISLEPIEKFAALGSELIDFRVKRTLSALGKESE